MTRTDPKSYVGKGKGEERGKAKVEPKTGVECGVVECNNWEMQKV
jgi:hypothetical protein